MRTNGYTAEPKPYQVSIILQPKRQKNNCNILSLNNIFVQRFITSSKYVNKSIQGCKYREMFILKESDDAASQHRYRSSCICISALIKH